MPKFTPQRLTRGINLTALTADAAGPGVPTQRVDHRASDAALGEGLELDPAILVEPPRRIDKPEHAVLHEIPDINRVGHGRRHPTGKRLHKGEACDDAASLTGWDGLGTHGFQVSSTAGAHRIVSDSTAISIATAIPTVEF
jgi:hypothetical protein